MAEDDATMADDMSVEKKIELLAEKIDALTVKTDALTVKTDALTVKTDALTVKTDALTVKTDALTVKTDALTVQTDALTVQTDGLASDVGGIRSDLDQLSARVSVGFEESHRLMKVSLEGLGALRETTDARFDTMSDEHSKQFDLLTKFGVHLRRRVERIDPPPRRRR
jgi:uncharacterized protein YoxC